MPREEILGLATPLVAGIVAAHGQGIVHRDLKPGNLHVIPNGWLKILDFGLARPASILGPQNPTDTTSDLPSVSGTLFNMSPEQLWGDPVNERSDIYSIGVVLYEMATGCVPSNPQLFPADRCHSARCPIGTCTLAARTLHSTGTDRPEVSGEGSPDRFQSAPELLTDLRIARRASVRGKSVAVLYFENLGGRKEDEDFRDGINEDITTELSKIKEPRVFSRSAVLACRDKPVAPAQVSRELTARYVLEGSLRRDADPVLLAVHCLSLQGQARSKSSLFCWSVA